MLQCHQRQIFCKIAQQRHLLSFLSFNLNNHGLVPWVAATSVQQYTSTFPCHHGAGQNLFLIGCLKHALHCYGWFSD